MFSRLTSSRIWPTSDCFNPQPRPRPRPRRAARLRFSSMVRLGDVPLKGFWNTRPISWARACSSHRVTSRPASRMVPSSTRNVPATAFSRVDFPEPLVPMMITQEPAASSWFTPRRERISLGVPELNVFATPRISSMGNPQALFAQKLRHDEGAEHEHCRDQLQVVGTKTPPQRHSDQQPEEHRTHHRADDRSAKLVCSCECYHDNDACQPPYHHSDSHAHVREPLVLRQQGSGQRHEAVRDHHSEYDHIGVVDS